MYKRPDTPYPTKLPPLKTCFKGSNLNLDKLDIKEDKIIYSNKKGKIDFQKKLYYSYEEVICLLEKLDKVWDVESKYDYFS